MKAKKNSEQQLYVEILKHLEQKMARSLLSKSNVSLGIQVEFYHQWSTWSQTAEGVCTDVVKSDSTEKKEKTLDLATILNSNPYGQSVIQSYETNGSLNENLRKLLCESIIHYCIDKSHSLSVKDSEHLAKQIILAFPKEEMVIFKYFLYSVHIYSKYLFLILGILLYKSSKCCTPWEVIQQI